MMQFKSFKTGKIIEIYPKEIASGGEGKIYRTNGTGLLAKIYDSTKDSTKLSRLQTTAKKLQVMIVNKPNIFSFEEHHIPIAWPEDLLLDHSGACLGFLMPEVKNSKTFLDVYHPKRRREVFPEFTWRNLHITALSLAFLMHELHARNYVVCDLKPENLLVDRQGFASIIDTDSFQVTDPSTGKTYLSTVASLEHTAPEMFGDALAVTPRSKFQDHFSLATIIWLLLLGYHPFKPSNSRSSPNIDENIRHGLWMNGTNIQAESGESSFPPLTILHPELQKCFHQCFTHGHKDPSARTSSISWVEALLKAIDSLTDCRIVSSHCYLSSHKDCYWCKRHKLLKDDVFEASSKIRILPDLTKLREEFQQTLEPESYIRRERAWLEKELAKERNLRRKEDEISRQKVEILQDQLAEAQQKSKDLQTTLNKQISNSADLNKRINDLQDNIDELQRNQGVLQTDLNLKNGENQDARIQLKNLQDQLAKFQVQNSRRKIFKVLGWGLSIFLLAVIGSVIYFGYHESQNLYRQISNLEENLDKSRDKLDATESELGESQEKLNTVEDVLRKSQNDLKTTQGELKKSRRELKIAESELIKAKTEQSERIKTKISQLKDSARQGSLDSVTSTLEEILKTDSDSWQGIELTSDDWNSLCWFGSISNFAAKVLFACEKALELAPNDPGIRDSRGLARARTRDFEGAIGDFQAFLNSSSGRKKENRQDWINSLKSGQDPFTPEVLRSLLNE